MLPNVYIIILNWNNLKDTEECLRALESITYPNYKVIVVDNGSTDGSVEKLKREFPQHIFIKNAKNFGFSKGNNIGIKYALNSGADYILLLNNDTVVKSENFLELLVKVAESDKQIGIVAPKMLNASDQRVIDSTGHIFRFGRIIDRGCGKIDTGQYDHKLTVIGSCAGASFYKKAMLEMMGLFDEIFFMQYEDAELSWRSYIKGWKGKFVPQAIVFHKRGGTKERDANILYQSTLLNLKNTIITVRRHATLSQKVLFASWFVYAAIKSETKRWFRGGQIGLKSFLQALREVHYEHK